MRALRRAVGEGLCEAAVDIAKPRESAAEIPLASETAVEAVSSWLSRPQGSLSRDLRHAVKAGGVQAEAEADGYRGGSSAGRQVGG